MLALAVLLFLFQSPVEDAAAAFQQGRLADAERTLRSEVARNATDAHALMLLGVVLDSQKRYAEAEPFYVRALKLSPHVPAVLNNLGNHYVAAGNRDEARRTFERVVALDPKHTNANLQLAKLAIAAGQPEAAVRYAGRTGDDTVVRVIGAEALAISGRANDAIAALASNAQLLGAAGFGLAEAGHFAPAEQLLAAAVERSPADFDLLYNLGLAAARAKHSERALEVFQTALRQRPNDADTLYNIGAIHAERGDFESAMFSFGAARRAAPDRPDILAALARACDGAGWHSDAALAWTEYLKLKPGDDEARRERGFAWTRAGNAEQARADLGWYVERHPRNALGHFQLAIAFSSSDAARTLELLNRTIALDPNMVPALYARGSLLEQDGKAAQALPDLERAIQLDSSNAQAFDRLGLVYRALGRHADAERVLRKAAELTPNDGPVLIHLSMALRENGKREEAAAYLDRFRKLSAGQHPKIVRSGMLSFLSLSPTEQRAQYLRNLRNAIGHPGYDANELRLRLGTALLDEGEPEEAERTFQEMLGASPSEDVLARTGRALLEHERYAAAREYLQRAGASLDLAIAEFHLTGALAGMSVLDTIPEAKRDGDYWLARAQMLDAANRFGDAVTALNRGLGAAPTRPDLYYEASLFLIKHDRLESAADLLRQATSRMQDEAELRLLYAIVLELAGKTDDAQHELTALQQRWPEWDRPWLIDGIILASRVKPGEARPMLENAIALGSQDSAAYFYLADAITNSAPGEVDAAYRAAAKAVELAPADPYAHALAGKIEMRRGNTVRAVEHLKRAVELLPELSEAHNLLSRAYMQTGNREAAAQEAQLVRRLAEEHREADPEPPAKKTLFQVRAPRS